MSAYITLIIGIYFNNQKNLYDSRFFQDKGMICILKSIKECIVHVKYLKCTKDNVLYMLGKFFLYIIHIDKTDNVPPSSVIRIQLTAANDQ